MKDLKLNQQSISKAKIKKIYGEAKDPVSAENMYHKTYKKLWSQYNSHESLNNHNYIPRNCEYYMKQKEPFYLQTATNLNSSELDSLGYTIGSYLLCVDMNNKEVKELGFYTQLNRKNNLKKLLENE